MIKVKVMKCEEAIAAIIDGQETRKQMDEAITMHLESCVACRKEAEEIKLLLGKIGDAPLQQPSATLAAAFHDQLRAEMTSTVLPKKKPIYLQVAAALIFVLFGAWLTYGLVNNKATNDQSEVAALKNEVKTMKEKMVLGLLQNESASQRIQATAYVREIHSPDVKVINALVHTLNTDPSVNVRLAALYVLKNQSTDPVVRDGLIDALQKQHEPVIQVLLIKLLADQKINRANKVIRQMIDQDVLDPEVKQEVLKSVNVL